MAVKKKKTKAKLPSIELTLWDVILSYPDLHEPKPYQGKTTYKTDIIMAKNSDSLSRVRKAIKEICLECYGDDQDEWPEKIAMPKNGDDREDSEGYAGKRYITAGTQNLDPSKIVDLKGKPFPPQSVKGGMFANVAVKVAAWSNEFGEGVSLYLDGVQIDTKKKPLAFGSSGRSVDAMFSRDEDDSDDSDSDDEEDEDDQPRRKSKKKPARDFDDEDEEDEAPRRSKKKPSRDDDEDDSDDEDEEDEPAPRKSKKKPARDFDDEQDEDERPARKSKKKTSRNFDDDED